MPVKVERESEELIRNMGWIGKIIELCTDCGNPTRFWADGGKFPLCESCAERRPDPLQEGEQE